MERAGDGEPGGAVRPLERLVPGLARAELPAPRHRAREGHRRQPRDGRRRQGQEGQAVPHPRQGQGQQRGRLQGALPALPRHLPHPLLVQRQLGGHQGHRLRDHHDSPGDPLARTQRRRYSRRSITVVRVPAGARPSSHAGNHALAYRFIGAVGTPLVHVRRVTPSTVKRTRPAPQAIS